MEVRHRVSSHQELKKCSGFIRPARNGLRVDSYIAHCYKLNIRWYVSFYFTEHDGFVRISELDAA